MRAVPTLQVGLILPLALWLGGCHDRLTGPVVLYGDPAELLPFPSNRYSVPADTPTGIVVSLTGTPDLLFNPGAGGTIAELEQMDGFSTTGGIVVGFSAPVDVAGIARLPPDHPDAAVPLRDARVFRGADSPLILIDVDPSSHRRGEPVGLVPRWWERAEDKKEERGEYLLIAEPAVPLLPSTRYLFVVTDALKSSDGLPVSRSETSEALLEGDLEGRYAEEVDAALDELESAIGVDRARVKLATTFTTASVTRGIQAVGLRARSTGAPDLLEPWTVETRATGDGRARFRAVYAAPEYRAPLPDGRWHFDRDGAPIVQGTSAIEVYMTISNTAGSAPRPVVIHAHGLGGNKDSSWEAAERLADLGVAVLAIDAPHHGARGGSGIRPDLGAILRFFGMDPETDRFVLGRARDNFRQNAADHLELVKLIRSMDRLDLLPAGAPDGAPDLDTSRILYIGQSFGAVQGPLVLALAPEISHAVWNVGGAGLMGLLRDSSLLSTILVGGLRPEHASDGALAHSMAITQAVLDPGDPLNFARYVTREPLAGSSGWRPRTVLIQQALADAVVPAPSTEALARAAGLVLVDPLRPVTGMDAVQGPVRADPASGIAGALCQFDRIDGGQANHGNLIASEAARTQYVEFFRSALDEPQAVIAAPY